MHEADTTPPLRFVQAVGSGGSVPWGCCLAAGGDLLVVQNQYRLRLLSSSFPSKLLNLRVRFQIIGNERIKNVGKSQLCMVSKLPIIWKRTRSYGTATVHSESRIINALIGIALID